jgi:large subunit ribosomal protein L21
MYAVVTTGGKQYRVEAGSELIIEQLGAEAGASITFDRVLLVGDGDAVTVGTPTVDGASVSATVLGESLGPKLIIFKFKQKATYRRKNGHRQHMIRVRIDEINASGKKARSKPADAVEADAKAATDTPEKPKRARKPAAKASDAEAAPATDAPEKPKRTRKPAAKKTESEE